MAEGNWASGGADNIGVDIFVWPRFLRGRRDPTTNDIQNAGTRWYNEVSGMIYQTTGGGVWNQSGGAAATTTMYGTVILTDNSEPVATKAYVDAIAIAGAPVATETVAGIGELATDAEAVAGTPSTGALALLVTPSNFAAVFAAPPAIGGTTPSSGTFGALTADGTGAVSLGSSTAGDFTVATGDLTLEATTGSVIVNGEEAVDDAIQLTSAAGGLAASVALSCVIASTETNADSVQLTSGGGMDLTATGAAGKDIDVVCTSGSVNITAGENAADSIVISSTNGGIDISANGAAAGEDIDISASSSINLTSTENAPLAVYLHANGGASETIRLRSDQGTGANSIEFISDSGGILTQSGLDGANAIYLHANAGTSETIKIHADQGTGAAAIEVLADVGGVTVTSGLDAADCIYLHANAGTSEKIRIHADQGTAADSVALLSDAGGVSITGGLASADAVNIVASNAAGGVDIDAGTAGIIADTTGAVSLDSAAASNFTVTGAFDLTLDSSAGSVIIDGGEAAADAVDINASDAAGGIDIDAGTGGITIDTTGGLSLDSAAASNFTVTGAFDLTLDSTAGSVIIAGGEAVADAINIDASNAAGGIDIDAGTGGVAIDSTGSISLGAAAASDFTVTGAFDLALQSTAGSVNITAGESANDSIVISSTNGGIDITAAGAAAGEDIDISAVGSSVNISSSEAVGDAVVITASDAAGGVDIVAGTGSIHFNSGQIVKVTSLSNADTPYTVLGTDYFLACDTSAGVLTVTLPAATAVAGRTYVIRDVGGAAGANNITIGSGGTNLVGGGAAAASKTLAANYSGAVVYSDGTVWSYAYIA